MERIRNINIDIIKCLAVFFVLCVHFFLNNNFYQTTVTCPRMLIMVGMRTAFMTCVPLFLIVSGFLLWQKELSIKYYYGLKKIIFPYLILTVITAGVKILLQQYGIFTDINMTLSGFLNGLFEFNLIDYAWYVEMYIGLFLIIPFINKTLNNIRCVCGGGGKQT